MIATRLVERLRGGVAANVALMHLLMEAPSAEAASAALAEARRTVADDRVAAQGDAVARLWQQNPEAWRAVRTALAHAAHDAPAADQDAALDSWEGAFDALAGAAPEAAVALYALGSADLLAAATAEVVEQLDAWGHVALDRDVLDLGCGIGRFALALAPRVRSVLGIDLSARMVAEARRRCAHLPGVRFLKGSGRDLAGAPTGGFDLLLAADVFPYLVQAGEALVETHVAEARRVLRPGGSLVILNYSYRGDDAADRADVARRAAAAGFAMVRQGTRDFSLWDATAFHLRRSSSG